jgi:phospholipase/carboxylesterase
MWVFARNLSPHYWIVAPRAPHPSELGGYTWRPLQGEDFGRPSLEQLLPSAEALIRLVDEYQASVKIEAHDFDVMGFSQGGVMSSILALLYPQRVRKVGILSGFVPSGADEYVSERPLEGRPIFVAHGTKDETVPVDRAHASVKILEQAGAQVIYCEDEVGHKVSANCLQALRSYFEY